MIFETAALFLSGLISATYGTFSGGAALLTVPVMLFLGLSTAAAVATNRLVIFLMAATRLPFVHGQLGLGNKVPLIIIAAHTIGAIIGAILLTRFEENMSLFFIGVLLVAGGILTWFSPKGIERMEKKKITAVSLVIAAISMLVIGVYRGIFGPAAGILTRFVLVQFMGLNFTQTITLSSYATFFSSLAAVLIFFNAGLINFSFGVPLAIGGIIGIVITTKFALEKGDDFMKKLFVALSIIIGGYLAFSGGSA